ncbi:restriction endonuclease subunit S [Flavobacterium sp. RSP49]|uniref:restriction endonuclease subunit S n=1 Tax=Flavobacterium sp. RSP49 TaxID=2497487 RepID=UPI000F843920|nr:restriction endonuclease subunit S [Flavobacterium sp. RSP49]RTY97388.1 restriction endonuclease subunit S [Flavobacterium sp. RSP49]
MSIATLQIEKKKTLVPLLRFQEFEGEWEYEKLQARIKTIDSGWSPQCEEFPSTENEWGVLKTTSVVWEGFNESANKKLPEKLSPRPELQVSINDILITRAGPTSRVGVIVHVNKVRDKLMLSDKLIRIRSNEKCSSLFLAISLSNSNSQKQLVSKSSGLAESQTNISQKILLNTKLSFPSLPEQQKIASFLSAVDEKIQQLSRKKELLEQYKKGVMQQLFSGKLRFKDENGEDYADWERGRFSKFIKLYRGSSPRPIIKYITTSKDGVNWIKIGDTKHSKNYRIKSVSEKITKKGSLKSRFVERGEIILANSMSFGKSYLLQIDGCIYDGWFVLREYEKAYDKEFLLQVLNSEFLQRQYFRLSTGGVVQNISSEIVYSTLLFRPVINEQQKIANFLSSIDVKIESTNQQINQTQTFKKGLLQQMFV